MRYWVAVAVVALGSFAGAQASGQEAEPPSRVGRIAFVSGAVSFHLAGAERWERASLNLPLTDGAAIWTQPGAAATIGVAGDRIALDAATELELDKLDDHALASTQSQGESYWHLPALPGGDVATVRTPRGIVAFAAAGRYEVLSGDTEHPTEVTVLEGSAKVTGLPADVEIGPNQTLVITGDGTSAPFVPTLQSAGKDALLQRMLAAERPPARHVALPPAVALMTGSDVLAEEGDWGESPDYGPVWYPPVQSGYVPYRNGHWAYVGPWGWTWVDAAPWGFAPTHYGRWAEFEGRWGWIPGREWAPERRPVYAPALVAFVAGAAAGSWVGWAPLGPHDEYRPAYHVGPHYLETLNRPNGAVTNVTVVNRQAITVVPTQVMASSLDVGRVFRAAPPPQATTAAMQTVHFRAPVAPTGATIGASTSVLREAVGGPARPPAPGPAIVPAVAQPGHGGATLLGGAAVGGAAAALLHAPPRAALPPLRPNGMVRSAVPGAAFMPPPGPTPPVAPQPPTAAQAPPPVRVPPAAQVPPVGGVPRTQAVAPPPPEQHEFRQAAPERSPPRPEPARIVPPRPEPAEAAPAHSEPARHDQVSPASRGEPPHPPPRAEPPHPAPAAPQAQIRHPAPVAFHTPPRPPPPPHAAAPRPPEHREAGDHHRP